MTRSFLYTSDRARRERPCSILFACMIALSAQRCRKTLNTSIVCLVSRIYAHESIHFLIAEAKTFCYFARFGNGREMQVDIVANHSGAYGFRVCVYDKARRADMETRTCADACRLEAGSQHQRNVRLPWPSKADLTKPAIQVA